MTLWRHGTRGDSRLCVQRGSASWLSRRTLRRSSTAPSAAGRARRSGLVQQEQRRHLRDREEGKPAHRRCKKRWLLLQLKDTPECCRRGDGYPHRYRQHKERTKDRHGAKDQENGDRAAEPSRLEELDGARAAASEDLDGDDIENDRVCGPAGNASQDMPER